MRIHEAGREPAISASGLVKSFAGVRALDGVDLEVAPATVVGFVGPNGAGKTTVIRMLSTLLPPDSGMFRIAGVPMTAPAEIRRRIGVLPEGAGYPRAPTGEEWLIFHAELFGHPRSRARTIARRLLAELDLADRASREIATYSRGMRQRLGVARALVNDPQVVLLDEPTLGLDPAGQRRLLDLIAQTARHRGVAVLLSTHTLTEVEAVCDGVLVLDRGRVVAHGTVNDVVRVAAAPREIRIQIVPGSEAATADLLAIAVPAQTVHTGRGEVRIRLEPGVDPANAVTPILRTLLAANAPVTGVVTESARLDEAFLALTEGRSR